LTWPFVLMARLVSHPADAGQHSQPHANGGRPVPVLSGPLAAGF
jgi:hypothetical protein